MLCYSTQMNHDINIRNNEKYFKTSRLISKTQYGNNVIESENSNIFRRVL